MQGMSNINFNLEIVERLGPQLQEASVESPNAVTV